MSNFKTGMVLSGGAIRGVAHLGVLKAVEELDIKLDVISGTSIGAIIGAFFAQGYQADEIFDFYKDKNPFKYLRPQFPGSGLLNADKLFKDFKSYFESTRFEDLKIPLFITTTNLNTGKQAVFNSGSLFPVLKAASAVPVIFNPVTINDELHVDGGLISNMPVEPLIDKCEQMIGVNVNPIGEDNEIDSLNDILMRTLHLSIWGNTNKNIEKLHIYIEPQKLKKVSLIDQGKMEEIFFIGYEQARDALKNTQTLEILN